jgi:hypothetical protein
MRAALMLIAVFSLGASRALADPALEARVLRLEAQVKARQETLKTAVQMDRVYSLRTANGQPESCLSWRSTDASAAKAEVLSASATMATAVRAAGKSGRPSIISCAGLRSSASVRIKARVIPGAISGARPAASWR